MSNVIIVLAIVVYLAMMLYIGFIMSNKNKNTDDFYLGGLKARTAGYRHERGKPLI